MTCRTATTRSLRIAGHVHYSSFADQMPKCTLTMAAEGSESDSFTGGAAAAEARVGTLEILRRSSAV
jgi:hypothetical protein